MPAYLPVIRLLLQTNDQENRSALCSLQSRLTTMLLNDAISCCILELSFAEKGVTSRDDINKDRKLLLAKGFEKHESLWTVTEDY